MEVLATEIIVGTYEQFLLSYKLVRNEEKYELLQSFADHSHQASIRCLSGCAQLVASGSADETIYLYDTTMRKEIGVLMQHSGTVTSLAFSSNGSHLFSGSEDGSIAVFRTGSWQLEKLWHKAHRGEAVTYISIHPSGKLALSLGNDATLRTWNLVKGRQAYATNLGKQRTLGGKVFGGVVWSPDGNTYAVAIGPEVDVYDIESAGVVYAIKLDKKVTSVCFLQDSEILVGDESGHISWYSSAQKKLLQKVQAHENRVKCISSMKNTEKFAFVSASSLGEIKTWQQKNDSFWAVCKVNCGCRITCMVTVTKHEAWRTEECETKKHKATAENEAKSAKDVKPEVYKSADIRGNGTRKSGRKRKRTESSVICTNGQNWSVESVEMKL